MREDGQYKTGQMINAESDGWNASSLMFVYNALPIVPSSSRSH
jgi:hypothetical protein